MTLNLEAIVPLTICLISFVLIHFSLLGIQAAETTWYSGQRSSTEMYMRVRKVAFILLFLLLGYYEVFLVIISAFLISGIKTHFLIQPFIYLDKGEKVEGSFSKGAKVCEGFLKETKSLLFHVLENILNTRRLRGLSLF
jgi:hypothetical protein